MPKLGEIFDLPEQVNQGDFVLRLTDGLSAPAETVRNYIATPQLVKCFDQALGVVKGALDSQISKGAYLHGSFGSGKSHFMAILSLLLRGDASARGKPELAPVVSKHNGWTQGKRFLVVPYHMINAETLESALFSGYAELTARLHPDAPSPGFYQSEGMLNDARKLREQMGEETFFLTLNSATGMATGGGGWGRVAQTWTADRFETTLRLPPGSPERFQLVGALTGAFYGSVSHLSASQRELYTSLDEGLSAMSHHAKDLGYDGIILFLDEFILWLASRAADVAWIAREGQKVAKLVESGNADRPTPVISFMARQRDLREMVGEHMPGAEQLSFADTLQWWEARFDKVNLEDRNLPEIAKKRLLRTRGPAEESQLKGAINKLLSSQPEVLQTLLTRDGDQQMLQDLYPFTPALVQTLIAVSSMLQRERTALKLMQQMLVDKADTLEIGDVIPVGDLFDVIAGGDEPFTHGIKLFFEQAKQLWRRRLLPILETQHGLTWEDIEAGKADAKKAVALQNDARLLKTLVLAALVPEVEALKNLTPTKLAALNHGTIRTPVPGSEGITVLTKLKRWAGQAGEIKIADDSPNPMVSVEVAKVDTDAILANAMAFDTLGNRQAEVRQLITDGLGLADASSSLLPPELGISWRGSRRGAEILFGNVREHSFDTLKGREGTWRILIDFPFDHQQPDHGPLDDVAKINRFLNEGLVGRSVAWLPSFLSPNTQDQLGRLVVINFVLRGSNLDQYASQLSQADREQARVLLTNQRDQLRQFIRNCLFTAYGLNSIAQEALDPAQMVDEHFYSLDPSLVLRPPVAANFKDAFEKLAEQALDYEFPAHPHFEAEPRPIAVKRLAELMVLAAQKPAHRVELEASLRDDAKRIAPKLDLAEVGEAALQLRDDWSQHFTRQIAQQSGREPTVADLRRWLDLPDRRGLRVDLQDLVILTWLAQSNRSLYRFGQPFKGEIGNLPGECEVREQPLPTTTEWEQATKLAGDMLDPTMAALYRSAPGLVEFSRAARKRVSDTAAHLLNYLSVVEQLMTLVQTDVLVTGKPALRKIGATRLRDWFAAMESSGSEIDLVRILSRLDFSTEEVAEAKAVLAQVQALARVEAKHYLVNSLRSIASGGGEFAPDASQILERLAHAILRYEYVDGLEAAVAQFEGDAGALMADVANRTTPLTPQPQPTPEPEPAPEPEPGIKATQRIEHVRLMKSDALKTLADASALLEGLGEVSVDVRIVIREQE
ncbi:MAG: phage resistance protein [Chromatiaceae bacterium]|nr:phage resistance protein [Chromatiaceae bacterium]